MTTLLKSSVCFGADWKNATAEVALKVPLTVADASGNLHTVKDRDGNTPLHWAATHSSPQVIAALTDAGASPNEQNNDGDTPLHYAAAYCKDGDIVVAMVVEEDDLLEENNKGQSPFMLAAAHKNTNVIYAFCKAEWTTGALADALSHIASCVHSGDAAYYMCRQVAKDEWLDILSCDTPLQWAVSADNTEAAVGFMMYDGENEGEDDTNLYGIRIPFFCEWTSSDGDSILHFAAAEGASCKMMETLLDEGRVNVNHIDEDGRTPLDIAISEGHKELAECLREWGGYTCDESAGVCFGVDWKTATPEQVRKLNHNNRGGVFHGAPIHWAARFCPNPEVITALATSGADVNEDSYKVKLDEWWHRYDQNKPIHWAARHNNPAVIGALVGAGADVNAENEDGEFPLDIADERGDAEVRRALIKSGAVLSVNFLTIRIAPSLHIFTEWAEAEGWNPGLRDDTCYQIADEDGFLLGKTFDGKDTAIISAIRYSDEFGFLGFYIVRPEKRGQGVGMQMWNAAMKVLKDCTTIGLDGVADQRDNYAKSGFKFAFLNVRREFAGGGEMPDHSGIKKPLVAYHIEGKTDEMRDGIVELKWLPFNVVADYLLPFFPVPRSDFYEAWICQPKVVALGYLRGGKLAGVGVMRKCRNGRKVAPLFADDYGIADMLLRALKAQATAGEPLFMDMPDINPAAEPMARWHKMKECFTIARMYKGKMPTLPMDKIYAITSPEIG